MSQFLPCFIFNQQWEVNYAPSLGGPYASVMDSNGAPVIGGINKAFYPADYARIAALPENERELEVQAFYLKTFWLPSNIGGISDQDIAVHLYDGSVNEGPQTAVIQLQAGYNQLRAFQEEPLALDGLIGPLTLDAVNSIEPDRMLAAYTAQRIAAYRQDALRNPGLAKDLPSWIARAQAVWKE